jgi:hypothetical protein
VGGSYFEEAQRRKRRIFPRRLTEENGNKLKDAKRVEGSLEIRKPLRIDERFSSLAKYVLAANYYECAWELFRFGHFKGLSHEAASARARGLTSCVVVSDVRPGFAGYAVQAAVPESVVALRATACERRLRGHVEGGLDHRLARITNSCLRQNAVVLQGAA